MYNQSYDEYIRSILGYPLNNNSFVSNSRNTYEYTNSSDNLNLEEFYPDIYRIINPMVQKVCTENTSPLTRQTIDEMVEIIYSNVENDEGVLNRGYTVTDEKSKIDNKINRSQENTRQTSQARQRNFVLQDLIRILLLKELTKRPQRPPYRPGIPGGSGVPGGRPPFINNNIQPPFINNRSGIFDEGYNIF